MSWYIKANFIRDPDNNLTFIATQGPIPASVQNFIRMLYEHNVTKVYMLCKLTEKG